MGHGNYWNKNEQFIYVGFPDTEGQDCAEASEELELALQDLQELCNTAKAPDSFPVRVLQDESYFVITMGAGDTYRYQFPGCWESNQRKSWGAFLKRMAKHAPDLNIQFRRCAWTSGRCKLSEYIAANFGGAK